MIDKHALSEFIESKLADTDYFLVDVEVSKENEIRVEIDSKENVDLDFCIELTRAIEEAFPRDDEDYELEVGSAGLTSPLKVRAQYDKNLNNPVEVLTKDGRKLYGTLISADEDGFVVSGMVKVRKEGAKRPVEELREERFGYGDVKYVKYDLQF